MQILGIFFDHLSSLPPLGDNQKFNHNVADITKLLSDSLGLLTSTSDAHHNVKFLHTELMIAACCYCYRLLTYTHPFACNQDVVSLAANLFSCDHTSDTVVTCFVSLCSHHSVHEVSQCILVEMKRKPLSTNIISTLKPTFLTVSVSMPNSELLTVVSHFVCEYSKYQYHLFIRYMNY